MGKGKLVFIFVLFFSVSTHAQTVKWCVHPEYDHISYFGRDLFKCVDRSGKVQLFDQNGKALLRDVDADAVTDFEEGLAIILKGNKLVGFLTEASGHGFQPVTGDYMITQYAFFSEGMIPVADSKGKLGYMDARGSLVIPCKFEKARPFRQGWASVEMSKKKVYYINPQGKTKNPEGFHGGNLTKGSSFNENGEAVVANYQDYAVIKTDMQVKNKIEYTPDLPVRSCDYAYSKGVKEDCRESDRIDLDEDPRIEAYSKNGTYGYRWKSGKDEDRLPEQFSEAKPFIDGRAIVVKNGKYGVLELVDGAFSADWPKEVRVYPNGECGRVRFTLNVPSSLDRGKVELEFDKGDGIYQKHVPLDYEFQPNISQRSNYCTFRGRVYYDGLLLWDNEEEIRVSPVTISIKSPVVTAEFADENDNQTVKTIITNTSDVDVFVEAVLKVDGQPVQFKGSLKPKQSKPLTKTLKVTETKSVSASVTVKADGYECGSKNSIVSLKL